MEIVIKIPEEIMEYIKNNGCLSVFYIDEVAKVIKNGTPLPKGHGRLIDKDAIGEKLHRYTEAPYQYAIKVFNDAPTIIESDNEQNLRMLEN